MSQRKPSFLVAHTTVWSILTRSRSGFLGITASLVLSVLAAGWPLLFHPPVQAAPGILYVAPGGNCGGVTPCFGTVQEAVDAAVGEDEIRVAAGTYLGVNNQGGLAQSVYIAKSLTIRGGYTTTNWNTPDPEANTTELNAMTLGRVVYVTGAATEVTLEGVHLTYGDSTGLGGSTSGYDAGGGVYALDASVALRHCWITQGNAPSNGYGGGLYIRNGVLDMAAAILETNAAGHGGALYLSGSQTRISEDSQFRDNRTTATNGEGAAIAVAGTGAFTFTDSLLENNEADAGAPFAGALNIAAGTFRIENSVFSSTVDTHGVALAGDGVLRNSLVHGSDFVGVVVGEGTIVLAGNEIRYNGGHDTGFGGGVRVQPVTAGQVTLVGNWIHHNQDNYATCQGGGVYIDADAGSVFLQHNRIQDNAAGPGALSYGFGGGVYIVGDNATLEANLIQDNTAVGIIDPGDHPLGGKGGGLYIFSGDPTLINNVVTGNSGRFAGSGLYVYGSSPALYHNTIAENRYAIDGDETGLYVVESSAGDRSQVQMYNTVVVSQEVGIYAKGDEVANIVVADGVLWSGNISDTWGTGTFFLSHVYTGTPAFADPLNGDYHITAGSAALDRGVSTATGLDIDDEPRFGIADLGADEYWTPGALQRVHLPLVVKQQ